MLAHPFVVGEPASAALAAAARLWTRDRRLVAIATELNPVCQ